MDASAREIALGLMAAIGALVCIFIAIWQLAHV